MTPEEKDLILKFMGQTYGGLHKQDQMLVSPSQHLQPKSQELKQKFEEVMKVPVNQFAEQHPQPVVEQAPVVSVQQAAQELYEIEGVQSDPQQLEMNFTEPSKVDTIIDLLKEQNLKLDKLILSLQNGKTTKSRKPG